jgi:hypothetical protein
VLFVVIPQQAEFLFHPLLTRLNRFNAYKSGHIEIHRLAIVPFSHRPFSNGNSTKEVLNNMKSRQLFSSILAVLFLFPMMGAFAQQARNSGSIEVITTFDYPGVGNSTLPQKINEIGDIVGEFIDSSGVVRGFTRFVNGNFSAPIVDPNDTVGFTEGRGINNFRKVVGDYAATDGTLHSFSLFGNHFTEYDVPNAVQTNLLGINELGDLTGGFDPDGGGVFQGFIDRRGTITSFSVPNAASTFTYELNDTRRLAVGYYIDASGILHGYYRDHNGTLHFPIDPPGSVATVLFGVGDTNFVVGRYADAAGATHGLFFVPPDNFFTFDYPGSTFTSLNGINLFGFICGRFNDAAGIGHGFIARLRGIPHGNGANQLATPLNTPSLATPLDQSRSAWGGVTPAR